MPATALQALADHLLAESVIAPHVTDPRQQPALGLLAASGPGAAADPAAYALVVESVREGYLLHYGEPRVVTGADPDLALLAGDYLYALGLEQLAGLGDLAAIRELSDLISLAAQLHAEGRDGEEADALWLATATVIAAGEAGALDAAKSALRSGAPGAAAALSDATHELATRAGLSAAPDG